MKRFLLLSAATLTIIATYSSVKVAAHGDDERYERTEKSRIERGFQINPVRLNLYDKDLELVGLGSYLVNATGGCNDCHTNPSYANGGNPFLGQPKQVNADHYLGGGQHFGPFVSRNLTPEKGLHAGRTYREIKQIMRRGTDFDNPSQLLQVMPWPGYQDLSDHDLRAIYEYLRAIPPATPGS